MYKAEYNICPPNIKDLFKQEKSHYRLRNSGNFFIPRFCATTYGKHSLRNAGPLIWSKLSNDIKEAESSHNFKKKIRQVDLQQVTTDGCKSCLLCSG